MNNWDVRDILKRKIASQFTVNLADLKKEKWQNAKNVNTDNKIKSLWTYPLPLVVGGYLGLAVNGKYLEFLGVSYLSNPHWPSK